VALLIDPMLATGGSAVRACEIIKAAGVPRLKLLSLIAAPEGISLMNRAMPDVSIYVGAIDERLNEVGYIFPGLGDAGDRQFGTTPAQCTLKIPRKKSASVGCVAIIGYFITLSRPLDHYANCRHHSQKTRWACTHASGSRRHGRGDRQR